MIYTSYYAQLRNIPKDITPYAISNSIPKGVTVQEKLTAFVPDWENVARYKADGDWKRFKDDYLSQLNRLTSIYLPDDDIVLLCYEKDASVCHRSILAEWLQEKFFIEVKEWTRDTA